MLREMGTTYGKSVGGYLWVILEPVLGIALLSFVFSLAFRSPSLGTNFAIFYATAYLPYFMYMDLSRKVGSSIIFSRPLLTYPAVTFMDAILARFLLTLITHVVVFYILITGIELVFRTHTIHNYSYMVSAVSMAAMLGLGIGSLNCFYGRYSQHGSAYGASSTNPYFSFQACFMFSKISHQPTKSFCGLIR